MASKRLASKLLEEVTCPICMEILQNPVTIDCGHNFCLECIDKVEEVRENLHCPLCKVSVSKNTFRPNKLLASLAEKIQAMDAAETEPEEEEPRCQEHKEKFHYFCETDGKFLCVVCCDSKDHKFHDFILITEAAQKYKVQTESQVQDLVQNHKEIIEEKERGERAIQVFREQIPKCLMCLRKEREEIQATQSRENKRIQVLLTQVATKRQQVISQFAHLSQFLEEQQSILLAQLERLDGDILRQQEEFDALATGEICWFSNLIEELEEKNKLPSRRLLTDIRSTLIRCKSRKYRKPEAISPELGQRIRDFVQQTIPLQQEMKTFLEKLCFELDYEPAHIALDPQTSHPKLLLSEDNHRARFSYKWQNSPDTPHRFDQATCVLAQRGFTGGRHTWVVNVDLAHGGSCTVGVMRENVRRKGELSLRPEEGIWALRLAWGFVSALGSFPIRLALEAQPRKVQVSLDYEVGWVTFINAITQEHIYTFTASFTQEIFPLFGLWGRGSSFSLSCQEGAVSLL